LEIPNYFHQIVKLIRTDRCYQPYGFNTWTFELENDSYLWKNNPRQIAEEDGKSK
jgi:hypothetical protein